MLPACRQTPMWDQGAFIERYTVVTSSMLTINDDPTRVVAWVDINMIAVPIIKLSNVNLISNMFFSMHAWLNYKFHASTMVWHTDTTWQSVSSNVINQDISGYFISFIFFVWLQFPEITWGKFWLFHNWEVQKETIPNQHENATYAKVGNFHVNPRFHSTSAGWNLGSSRKLPTSAYVYSPGQKIGLDFSAFIVNSTIITYGGFRNQHGKIQPLSNAETAWRIWVYYYYKYI